MHTGIFHISRQCHWFELNWFICSEPTPVPVCVPEDKLLRVNNNNNSHSSSINNTTVIAQYSMPTQRSLFRANAKWKVKCTNRRKMPLLSDTWDNSKRLSFSMPRTWSSLCMAKGTCVASNNFSLRAIKSGESIARTISAHCNQRWKINCLTILSIQYLLSPR